MVSAAVGGKNLGERHRLYGYRPDPGTRHGARLLSPLPYRKVSGRRHDTEAQLELRLDPAVGAKRLRNYLKTVNMELTKLAGTSWIPGQAT